MVKKNYRSRIYGTEWIVDGKKVKKIKESTETNFDIVDTLELDEEINTFSCGGRTISMCPRGYLVSGNWCPTPEVAIAVSDSLGGAAIYMYDEVV